MKRCLIHIGYCGIEPIPTNIALHKQYSFFEFAFDSQENLETQIANFMRMLKESSEFYDKAKQE